MTTVQDVKHEAVEVAESHWAERLARFGHFARGVTFCLVGVLALEVAFGVGGKITDREGALQTLAGDPIGRLVLGALAVGLAGYALWRFAQALLGERLETGEDVSVWKRIGNVGKGVIYSGLAIICARLVFQADEAGGGKKDEDRVTGWILDQPAGRWLVAVIGVAIVGVGAFNFFRAVTGKFREDLKEQQMGTAERRWYIAIGVVGHFARAAVFTLAGLFLLKAAYEYDPEEAIGLDGALAKVAQAEYGTMLLVLVASGLFAYGLFSMVQARYRKV
jgi:Domain of Unknown Function (DUF1206)